MKEEVEQPMILAIISVIGVLMLGAYTPLGVTNALLIVSVLILTAIFLHIVKRKQKREYIQRKE